MVELWTAIFHTPREMGPYLVNFSNPAQLSTKFILLNNTCWHFKVNQHDKDLKQETSLFVGILVFDEQWKYRPQLS